LNEPLGPDELHALKSALQVNSFMDMMRTKEPEFKTAQLSRTSSENDLLNALIQYPKLLERPIVSNGTQAIIGRPPENVNVLL
jgi:arsenate reductase